MAAATWPSPQPPAKRARVDSPSPDGTLHITAGGIQDRLTIHEAWALDTRPRLVRQAMDNPPDSAAAPPLQKYGIQVFMPLDETNPSKLLPLVAGYLNLSYTNQLSLLWKAMEGKLAKFYEEEKVRFLVTGTKPN